VELDGGQHLHQTAYDNRRTAMLEQHGFRVLRFWDDDVLLRSDAVANAIYNALTRSSP
jgi:very-short-patch-repair endonuclease